MCVMAKKSMFRILKVGKRVRRINKIRMQRWEEYVQSISGCRGEHTKANDEIRLLKGQFLTNISLDNIYSALISIRLILIIVMFLLMLLVFKKVQVA